MAVYYNAEDAIAFISEKDVDVVLVDVNLPGQSGLVAIKKLVPLMPATQFCVFSMYDDTDTILESINAGAKGYILKDAQPDALFQAIADLHNGGSPISPQIARKILQNFRLSSVSTGSEDLNQLTNREMELLNPVSYTHLTLPTKA